MYIKQLDIKNIRAIKSFKMGFEKPAGGHVSIMLAQDRPIFCAEYSHL
jgi:hypothetical protein